MRNAILYALLVAALMVYGTAAADEACPSGASCGMDVTIFHAASESFTTSSRVIGSKTYYMITNGATCAMIDRNTSDPAWALTTGIQPETPGHHWQTLAGFTDGPVGDKLCCVMTCVEYNNQLSIPYGNCQGPSPGYCVSCHNVCSGGWQQCPNQHLNYGPLAPGT